MGDSVAVREVGWGEPVLAVECTERDGPHIRAVRPVQLSIETLRLFYEKLSDFDVIFNDDIEGSFEGFLSCFLYQDNEGKIRPTGLIWQVDDVGILYMTDIRPGLDAKAHFSFWDQRLRGRELLVRKMSQYVMEEYDLYWLIVEAPLYSRPTLKFVERVGFEKQGRLEKAVSYKGELWDVNLYLLLRSKFDGSAQTEG